MLLTISLTLFWSYGILALIFQSLIGLQGIYWLIPPTVTPLLVGLTLDYDIFLLMRILEVRLNGQDMHTAVRLGTKATTGVISVAGVIMAVAFASLLFSHLQVLQEW